MFRNENQKFVINGTIRSPNFKYFLHIYRCAKLRITYYASIHTNSHSYNFSLWVTQQRHRKNVKIENASASDNTSRGFTLSYRLNINSQLTPFISRSEKQAHCRKNFFLDRLSCHHCRSGMHLRHNGTPHPELRIYW